MHGEVRRLLEWLRPYRRRMAAATVLQAGAVCASVLLMGTSAWLISAAALHPSIAFLQLSIVGVRFFGIARGVLRYGERLVSHDVTLRVLSAIRVRIYDALEPLAPARLMSRGSGELLGRLVDDVETLEHLFVRVLGPSVAAVIVALAVAALLAPHGAALATVATFGLASAALIVPRIGASLARTAGARTVALRARLYGEIADAVQGIPDLFALNAADAQADRIAATAADLARVQRTSALSAALVSSATSLVADLTALVVLVLALNAGAFDRVNLAVVTLLTLAAFEAVLPLPAAYQHLSSIRASARRVFDLLDAEPAVREPVRPAVLPDGRSLALEHLTFAYPGAAGAALHDVSISVAAGRPVAVVGANGSGKSTIAHLVLRFWDAGPGSIRIDDRDVTELQSAEARRLVAWVSQRTHLFAGTVRDNLRIARADATDSELWEAAKRARLDAVVAALPAGLDTWLGEQGMQLSGGERQRLALARAFLKDAPILVLDEATSHLDGEMEREILAELRGLAATRALLYITHRLDGLEWMDEIVVLDEGWVVERGTYAELSAADTRFRRMRSLQHDVTGASPTNT